MRKQSDRTKLRHARMKLRNALKCLDQIGKQPDLPNPERDADWKNCMKNAAYSARETAKAIQMHRTRDSIRAP